MANDRWLHTPERTVAAGPCVGFGFNPYQWALPLSVQVFPWSGLVEIAILCVSLKLRRPR